MVSGRLYTLYICATLYRYSNDSGQPYIMILHTKLAGTLELILHNRALRKCLIIISHTLTVRHMALADPSHAHPSHTQPCLHANVGHVGNGTACGLPNPWSLVMHNPAHMYANVGHVGDGTACGLPNPWSLVMHNPAHMQM
jgi:hypothetical protein